MSGLVSRPAAGNNRGLLAVPVVADARPDMSMVLRPCLFTLALLACGLTRGEENWPSFRGPRGNGHASAADLPITWSETENVRWKTPVHGKAWSSPVVWKNQIWMTTAPEDGTFMGAVCVDLESGRIEHDIKLWDVAEPQFCYEFNSYASSTPVIEEGRLYVHFGTHGTACLDTGSGQILWKRLDLHCNHHRGAGSSPIVFENLLILTFDGFDVQYLIALDKQTGKTVWRRDRDIEYHSNNGDVKKSYSTPQVIEVDGQLQMISPSSAAMIAYDPRTGEELWRARTGGFNAASRPLYGNGLVFANTEGGWNLFAVDPRGSGDITATNLAWKSAKGTPRRSTPLLLGERLFTAGDNGIAACLDAKTGKTVSQQRLGGAYSASPIYADGRIYLFSEEGDCPVIEPADEFKLLATNQVEDGRMASPAVAGNSLIVRSRKHLYRISK